MAIKSKRIPHFSGYYALSNGYIKSTARQDMTMKAWLNQHGEPVVTLMNDKGNPQTIEVKILIARAFVPNPEEFPNVRRTDPDVWNNRAINLNWTRKRG